MEVYTTAPGLKQILMTYSLPGGRVKRGEAYKELAWCMAHSRCSVMFCEGGTPAHLGVHLPSGKDTCPLGGPLNRAPEQKLCYTLGMAGGVPEWSGMELEGAGLASGRGPGTTRLKLGPGQPAGGQPQVHTQRLGLAQARCFGNPEPAGAYPASPPPS